MSFDHYILKGHEVVAVPVKTRDQLFEWAQAFETCDRVVMQTRLIDGSLISTVFLGLDHAFGHGPPILFETGLFSGEKHYDPILKREFSNAEIVARYATWAQAEEGHMQWIEKCVPPDMIELTAKGQNV